MALFTFNCKPIYIFTLTIKQIQCIAEEIVFRFFIINVFITISDKHINKKHTAIISMFLGVVPHSLCHFSELWIISPVNAITMLMLTSLFFGLPMAYLQYKRDLETAISLELYKGQTSDGWNILDFLIGN